MAIMSLSHHFLSQIAFCRALRGVFSFDKCTEASNPRWHPAKIYICRADGVQKPLPKVQINKNFQRKIVYTFVPIIFAYVLGAQKVTQNLFLVEKFWYALLPKILPSASI